MNGPGIERVIGAAVGRVVSMEAAPGIASNPDGAAAVLNEVETARSQEYALFATLLAQAPDATLLQRLAKLDGDATPLGNAHARLAEAASAHPAEEIAREYFELFIGVGRGELLPYGSYYLTGFLHEHPLARLRADLARLGIEPVDAKGEPEDHAAILCEIMAGLATGKFPADPEHQRQFFERHLAPWMGRFFADLEAAQAAKFYRPVGAIGRLFIDIETAAFALPG
jgi:TorA maturation chaperone TorD